MTGKGTGTAGHPAGSGQTRYAGVLLAFFGALALVLYPMLGHLHLPLADMPNHIARFAVMARADGPLAQYYSVESNLLTPNSAVDLLWQSTGMQGDPVLFARTTMIFYAVNFMVAVMVLGRVATGRWSAWHAVAGLLVYNGSFIWGFQNYVFTVPFSLYALSLWLVMERRSVVLRAALFLPICIALFLMHLLAFGALAIAVLGREVQRLWAAGPGWPRQLARGVISALPYAVPLAWFVIQALSQPAGELGTRTEFGSWMTRLRALLSLQWEAPLYEYPAFMASAVIVMAVLGLCFLTFARKTGPRLQIAEPLKGPIIAMVVVSLLVPSWLNGVALVQIRFPFIAVALMIAGSLWVDVPTRHKTVLSLIFAALFLQKSVLFERHWALHNADIRDLRVVLAEVPAGSRLLPLRAPGFERMRRLWHVQAYATTYHDVFVPTFFQGSHAVKLRPEWRDYAAAAYWPVDVRRAFFPDRVTGDDGPGYWTGWEGKFTHVLFLDPLDLPQEKADVLTALNTSGRFTLFEVTAPE